MIITTYGKDGSKVREAKGYAGGLCHQATLPYERREVPGSMTKTPTGEACLDPEEAAPVEVREKERA